MEKKYIHKFTWVNGVDGRKSLMDRIVVQEENSNKLLDVNLFRGAGWRNLGPSLSGSKNKRLEDVAWEDGKNGGAV